MTVRGSPLQRSTPWGLLLLLCVAGCERHPEGAAGETKQTPPLARAAGASSSASTSAVVDPPSAPEPAHVRLDGTSALLGVSAVGAGPRLHARHLRTWIHEAPSPESRRLGYLRAGASSPTSPSPAGYAGCEKGWYPVEPRGYVCAGNQATLDGNDPLVRALETLRPRRDTKLPYIYGTVRNPGPVYQRLPGVEELREAEPGVDRRMLDWFDAGGEIGASYAQHVWNWGEPVPDPRAVWTAKMSRGVPAFLQNGAVAPNPFLTPRPSTLVLDSMRPKVGYALLETFLHEGRRYGVSTHLELLPTDRLRPIQGSDFHGVQIGKDVTFPFAFIRRPGGHFVSATGGKAEEAEYRAVVRLTGKQKFFGGVLHYETKEGSYVSDRVASRLDPAKKMPGWATAGEKWIDVNLTKQTLVLYEGTEPVYATLISSGEAGLASSENTTATPRGIFRIHTKHITATMSSDESGEEFELRDVPYVQYFDTGGYALHGAYWHDRFGTPKSHGCLNLAPEDARRIFDWTEPQVPTGWHGALLPLKGTVLFIHP